MQEYTIIFPQGCPHCGKEGCGAKCDPALERGWQMLAQVAKRALAKRKEEVTA